MSTLTALISSGGGGEVTAVVPVNGIAQLNVEENLYTDSEGREWLRNGSLITTGLENYPDAIVKNDLISLSYNIIPSNIALSPNASIATGFCFSSDGLNLYYIQWSNKIIQYTLSIPYNGSSKISTKELTITTPGTESGIQISSDGTKFYLTNGTNLSYYTLSTPNDITTATFVQNVALGTSSRGFKFSPDGLKAFIAQSTTGIKEYNLVSAWDPIGMTASGNIAAASLDTYDITWKEDGTKFYIYYSTGSVREYNCSVAFSFSGTETSVATVTGILDNSNYGKVIFLIPDNTGKNFYINSFTNSGGLISVFRAATSYSISGLSTSIAFPAYQTATGGAYSADYPAIFNYDGTKVYAANDSSGSTYYQFSCPTPFNVSTATYDTKLASIGSVNVEWTNNGKTFISNLASFNRVDIRVANTPYNLTPSTSYSISSAIGGTMVNNGYQSVWISNSTPNTANISYSTTQYVPNGATAGTFNQSDSSYVDYKIVNPAYTIDGKYVFSAQGSGASVQYLLDAPFSMNIVNPVGSGPSGLYGKIKEYNGYWGGTASNIYNIYKKVNYIGFFSGNVNDFVRIK